MPLNVEALLAAKTEILAHPHSHLMGIWVADSGHATFQSEILEPEKNLCGTACCIAGTIVALTDQVDLRQYLLKGDIGNRAAQILGVGIVGSNVDLFFADRWPVDLQNRYREADNDRERAQAMATAIDEYIQDPKIFSISNSMDDEDDYEDDDYDDDDEEDLL